MRYTTFDRRLTLVKVGFFPFATSHCRAILGRFSLLSMPSCEQILVDLLHDLAQPLGAIETSAYCLDRHLDPHNQRAQEYLRLIREQVERANAMLAAAAAERAGARAEAPELTAH
ncbi:MAG TPA: hypothetical protein VKE70_15400 [Candidatus Solibacter sp.]|nr:hypothetical protein [Candidatus Solibacter sp.]